MLDDGLTDRITWTFDPLQSVNAHFNFAKLGVVGDTYKINVYGETAASFLHRNGTDRFFVTWLIDSMRVKDRIAGSAPAGKSHNLPRTALTLLSTSNVGLPERPSDLKELSSVDSVLIDIPSDINSIEKANLDGAQRWREETRHAFSKALAEGFVVTDYFLKNEQTGSYLLEKKPLEAFL